MVDVDEFELAADRGTARRRRLRGRARALPWVAAATALVLIGAATAEPVPELASDGPEIMLGVVGTSLAAAPRPAWVVDLAYAVPRGHEGTSLVVTLEGEPARYVTGLDLASGAERWRFADPDRTCHGVSPVVCVEAPGEDVAQVVTIDPSTGDVERREHPAAIAATAAGADLVVVERHGPGLDDVVRLAADGGERWRVQASAADDSEPPLASVAVVDDRVLIPLSGTRLDLATGEPVGTGSLVVGEQMWAELVEGRMVVHVGEGSATLAQDEVLLSIDDSLGAGLVLGQHPDGGAVARLRSTGEEVWRHEGCSPDVRLQHRVVLACWPPDGDGVGLVAVEEATGAEVWHLEGTYRPVTASRDTLVLAGYGGEGVLAVDPRTGDVRWRVPSETGVFVVVADGAGGLVVSDGTSTTRLVWD